MMKATIITMFVFWAAFGLWRGFLREVWVVRRKKPDSPIIHMIGELLTAPDWTVTDTGWRHPAGVHIVVNRSVMKDILVNGSSITYSREDKAWIIHRVNARQDGKRHDERIAVELANAVKAHFENKEK